MMFNGYEDFVPVHFLLNQRLLRELHRGGVTLLLGTDAGGMGIGLVPGFSIHDDLRILPENGLTPYAAIKKRGTVHAVQMLKKNDR